MRRAAGFTLLEVLVAVAVLGLALVSLLGLHVRNLALVERDQRVSDATLLARQVMTQAEVEGILDLGRTGGDFAAWYGDRFPDVRWEREVLDPGIPGIREIHVRVYRDDAPGDDVALTYMMRQQP